MPAPHHELSLQGGPPPGRGYTLSVARGCFTREVAEAGARGGW
ncbi:hypothetical protein DB31_7917 [Hyalangium minutum]|uniref:Uncharacterized protein n=1 Tax=Hyalangium minutum TaxID=394096 RepID=A0A085WLW7_9BACT|nr:hypothetical protein DB31_7917 [Hyalangium minutum]